MISETPFTLYNAVPLYNAVFSAENFHPKNRVIEGTIVGARTNSLAKEYIWKYLFRVG